MTAATRGGPPSAVRAEIGAAVATRLSENPAVQKIAAPEVEMFVLQGFLDASDCDYLIAAIDAVSRPSDIFVEGGSANHRTSYSGDLDRWDPRVEAVDDRICALMGIEPAKGETLQGQRYAPGQEFKAHHDFFHVDQPYWPEQEARGGQRTWTAMIYLDEPESGGETGFPHLGIGVQPRTGMLLLWNNMDANGAPNMQSLHAGMPVTAGMKHIVTKWFRERNWV